MINLSANMNLVGKALTLTHSRYTDIENDDLYQEASIALWKATQTFNASKGFEFSTYAIALMKNRLHDYAVSVRAARPPRAVYLEDERTVAAIAVDPITDAEEHEAQLRYLDHRGGLVRSNFDSLTDVQQSYVSDFLGMGHAAHMSIAGIATKYGVSKQTVAKTLKTAGRRLHKQTAPASDQR